jgi:hypothetical protein
MRGNCRAGVVSCVIDCGRGGSGEARGCCGRAEVRERSLSIGRAVVPGGIEKGP